MSILGSAKERMVSLQTLIAGENTSANVLRVEQSSTYSRINSATTTILNATGISGYIKGIVVSAATTATIVVYDNGAGSGNVIYNQPSVTIAANGYPFDIPLCSNCPNGLTIVTTGTVDCTVKYRGTVAP